MKIFQKAFVVIVLMFALAVSGVYVYIRVNGKALLEQALRDSFKKNVRLEVVSYRFPFGVYAKGIEVDGLLKAKAVAVQVRPDSFFVRKLNLSSVRIAQPFVNIHQKKTLSLEASQAVGAGQAPSGTVPYPVEKEPVQPSIQASRAAFSTLGVYIEELSIDDGHFSYLEESAQQQFSFDVEDVKVLARHVAFPVESVKSDFDISGRLVKEGNPLSGSRVEAAGWVNIARRDMDGHLEIVEEDGRAGLTADVAAQNNHMRINGSLKVSNLVMGAKKKEAVSDSPAVNDLVFGALSALNVEINSQFSFETKMDDFQMKNIAFSGSVASNSFNGMFPGTSP